MPSVDCSVSKRTSTSRLCHPASDSMCVRHSQVHQTASGHVSIVEFTRLLFFYYFLLGKLLLLLVCTTMAAAANCHSTQYIHTYIYIPITYIYAATTALMTNKATDDEIIIKEVANADILLHDLRDHFLGKHSGYLGLTTDYSLG